MDLDIKAKVTELVDKAKKDEKFKAELSKNPVKAVEGVLGVDLPDDQVKKIVDGVKAKISLDNAGDLLGKFFK
ncbi:MAG: hypothetical protein MJ112_06655 [Lachnospiraceae bacterium]|nr:hypothetical protein [Lachnospiraceae bacterium]